MDKDSDQARRARKRERNKADYAARKSHGEDLLLRLDKGNLAELDKARLAAGLSRSAFAKLYLIPLLGALGPRLGRIDAARSARGQTLATFLSRAIDAALAAPIETPPSAAAAASEFDSLFG